MASPLSGETVPTPMRSIRRTVPASLAAIPPPPLHAPHCTLAAESPLAEARCDHASNHPLAAT